MIVTVPAAGEFGWIADQQPQELPRNAWSTVRNVRFRQGSAERIGGDTAAFGTPSVVPYWVGMYGTSAKRFVIYAGIAKVFAHDGTTATEITPASAPTGAAANRWTGGTLNGVLVLNNGVDVPWYWGGNTASDLAALTGWDSGWKCKSLRPFKNFLIALNITKTSTVYPHMVKWSHSADPGAIPTSWDEADATLEAGEVDLAETPDLLVDALPLGDAMIVYKERSMYAMQYIGAPLIWQFRRLPGDVGMLAPGCAVDTPVGHVVLTSGDVVVHQGNGAQSVIDGKLRRQLFSTMDSTYYASSFLCVNARKSEVWVCFPEAGNSVCTSAYVWNWESGAWGQRDLQSVTYAASGQIDYTAGDLWSTDSITWDESTGAWDSSEYSPNEARLVMGSTGPALTIADNGVTYSGTAVAATLERTGITLDDTQRVKTLKGVWPRIDAPAGTVVLIQAGGSMSAETAPVWGTAVSYTVGSSRKADLFATGIFLSLRFSSTSSQPWRIKSFDLDVVQRGMY